MILPCVGTFGLAVAARSVLHVACKRLDDAPAPYRTLWSWDAATGTDQPMARIEADQIEGLSVSPDGRSILYGRNLALSDLMMIDNFR